MSRQGGNQGGNQGNQGNASNLSHEDRVKGGEESARLQERDESGQFAGRKEDSSAGASRGSSGGNDNRGGNNQGGNRSGGGNSPD